ncbi:GntR family transcriptional regulator [Brevibacillus laterosporus]|uniref:GntR family transcriptional regulator n=1 Tax=Brevibacillus laterosporus TaxID=1465 RepID=UPI000839C713|nr:GntR family transcriptional regulator [Brevibacillus laterosporus]
MPIPSNYVAPIRVSAKDHAFSHIQRWIIDGTLEPGEKLVDNQLAEALNVSRTPVREALQLLEVQGLVHMQPGKETRVTSLEKEDILKIYPTLATLHALAAEFASGHILPQHIEQLQEWNKKFAGAIAREQPFQAMEYDEQFHNLITDVADNPYLSKFHVSLQNHIRRFKYVFLKQPCEMNQASIHEHEDIILAIQTGDKEKLETSIKQNILRPMREIYALM